MPVALTDDEKMNAVCKLMIPSPTTSRYVSKTVDQEQFCTLIATIERNNQKFNSKAVGRRAKAELRVR